MVCALMLVFDGFNVFSLLGMPVKNFNEILVAAVIAIIASVFAGALTLYGVYLTIEDNKKEKYKESKRMVIPMIDISPAEYDYRWKYVQFDFNFTNESKTRGRKDIPNTETITIEIKNVGTRELYDMHLAEFESDFFDEGNNSYSLFPIIYSSHFYKVNFCLYEKGVYDFDVKEELFHLFGSTIKFSCIYKDCLGTCYRQRFSVNVFHQLLQGCSIEEKALNVSVERITIESAPEEISEKTYNDITKKSVIC